MRQITQHLKILLVLLSISVERFSVSRMRDKKNCLKKNIGAIIRIGQEIQSLLYTGFFLYVFVSLYLIPFKSFPFT